MSIYLTQNFLHQIFSYNPIDGGLYWKISNCPISKGTRAGCIQKKGYRQIKVLGKGYKEHRLVWFYHYGEWPINQIDHINNDRSDNRVENLREVTNSENAQNKRKITKGIYRHKSGKWHTRIGLNKKRLSVGYYDTEEEAIQAYIDAKKKYHPFFVYSEETECFPDQS
jgi:hypothetical protein